MFQPHARINTMTIALAFCLSTAGLAQEPKKVDVSLEFLTELNTAETALDTDSLVAWVKPVIGALESQFQQEQARRTIVVQVTLHPDRQADVLVAGKPALTPAERANVLNVADPIRSPMISSRTLTPTTPPNLHASKPVTRNSWKRTPRSKPV